MAAETTETAAQTTEARITPKHRKTFSLRKPRGTGLVVDALLRGNGKHRCGQAVSNSARKNPRIKHHCYASTSAHVRDAAAVPYTFDAATSFGEPAWLKAAPGWLMIFVFGHDEIQHCQVLLSWTSHFPPCHWFINMQPLLTFMTHGGVILLSPTSQFHFSTQEWRDKYSILTQCLIFNTSFFQHLLLLCWTI